ncbi:MAG: stage II sporulation protein R [Ruminococcus sp.]|nr:stage II sporulation protein R [Ruminococcus sp.]
MKLFMKVLISTFILMVTLTLVPFESTCSELCEDVFRLHILANSDSSFDQQLKLSVRDEVIEKISPLYDEVENKEDAIAITKNNLSYIEEIAENVLTQDGASYDVRARVTNKFFDTRYYDDFTMPAGEYDTLEISIGEAKGRNWWCVMYPSLCVGASSKMSMSEDLSEDEFEVITSDDIEYKFKIVEYFEKIRSVFN